MLGSGLVKISGQLKDKSFYAIMQDLQPWFRAFAGSGIFVMIGLVLLIIPALRILTKKKEIEPEKKPSAVIIPVLEIPILVNKPDQNKPSG
jgi:uncharacterized membrane protein